MAMQVANTQILPIAPTTTDPQAMMKWAQDLTRTLQQNLGNIARRANQADIPTSPLTANLNAAGFDITGIGNLTAVTATFSGAITGNGGAALSTLGVGLTANANTIVEIGYMGGTNHVAGIDFHTSATSVDFDARILASGNTGVIGAGKLDISATAGAFFTGEVNTVTNIVANTAASATAHSFMLNNSAGAASLLIGGAGNTTINFDDSKTFSLRKVAKANILDFSYTAAAAIWTLNNTGAVSMTSGLDFGSNSIGAGPSADLSKHIALYSTTYGFNITNGALGYIVPTSSKHQFTVNNVIAAEIDATLLNLPIGQIGFPATQIASAGANVLDDYEEGTWTPALAINGSATGITYTTQQGVYTKVGRKVHVQGRITLSNKGASVGVVLITGLPFTVNATYFGPGSLSYGSGFAALAGTPTVYANTGGTAGVLMDWGATGVAQITNAQVTNTTDMIFSMTYIV